MVISQKCHYALRAVLELAKRQGRGYASTAEIAQAQGIPRRFLEQILVQMKQSAYIRARRGAAGGYALVVPANRITVGDIIRFTDGPIDPIGCIVADHDTDRPDYGNHAFAALRIRARDAVSAVYDTTTFQQLIEEEQTDWNDYCI